MSQEDVPVLNSDYTIDYTFNVNVFLLKGGKPESVALQSSSPNTVNQAVSQAFDIQRAYVNQDLFQLPTSDAEAQAQQQTAARARIPLAVAVNQVLSEVNLAYASSYCFVNAWVGSFKIAALSQAQAQAATLEMTFNVEDIYDLNSSKSL